METCVTHATQTGTLDRNNRLWVSDYATLTGSPRPHPHSDRRSPATGTCGRADQPVLSARLEGYCAISVMRCRIRPDPARRWPRAPTGWRRIRSPSGFGTGAAPMAPEGTKKTSRTLNRAPSSRAARRRAGEVVGGPGRPQRTIPGHGRPATAATSRRGVTPRTSPSSRSPYGAATARTRPVRARPSACASCSKASPRTCCPHETRHAGRTRTLRRGRDLRPAARTVIPPPVRPLQPGAASTHKHLNDCLRQPVAGETLAPAHPLARRSPAPAHPHRPLQRRPRWRIPPGWRRSAGSTAYCRPGDSAHGGPEGAGRGHRAGPAACRCVIRRRRIERSNGFSAGLRTHRATVYRGAVAQLAHRKRDLHRRGGEPRLDLARGPEARPNRTATRTTARSPRAAAPVLLESRRHQAYAADRYLSTYRSGTRLDTRCPAQPAPARRPGCGPDRGGTGPAAGAASTWLVADRLLRKPRPPPRSERAARQSAQKGVLLRFGRRGGAGPAGVSHSRGRLNARYHGRPSARVPCR